MRRQVNSTPSNSKRCTFDGCASRKLAALLAAGSSHGHFVLVFGGERNIILPASGAIDGFGCFHKCRHHPTNIADSAISEGFFQPKPLFWLLTTRSNQKLPRRELKRLLVSKTAFEIAGEAPPPSPPNDFIWAKNFDFWLMNQR